MSPSTPRPNPTPSPTPSPTPTTPPSTTRSFRETVSLTMVEDAETAVREHELRG
jgi:hypothetical protein